MKNQNQNQNAKLLHLFGEVEEIKEEANEMSKSEIPEGVVPLEKTEAIEWDRWLSYEEIHKSILCFLGSEQSDDRGRVFLPVEIWFADTRRWRKAKLGYAYFLALMKGGLLKVGDCVYCEYTGERRVKGRMGRQFKVVKIGTREV